jgi:hypothetical protein
VGPECFYGCWKTYGSLGFFYESLRKKYCGFHLYREYEEFLGVKAASIIQKREQEHSTPRIN